MRKPRILVIVKGTVNVISSDSPSKNDNVRSTTVPLKVFSEECPKLFKLASKIIHNVINIKEIVNIFRRNVKNIFF